MQTTFSSQDQIRVGIQQYISKGDQILATTKYLLTDFVVNQIDLNGNLVVLKNKPQDMKAKVSKKQNISYQIDQNLLNQMRQVLGDQASKEIQVLYEKLQAGQKFIKWEIKIQAPTQKQKRGAIHTFIRQKLNNIQSTTVQGSIKLQYKKNVKKRNPTSRKKYIHFTLYKTNIDTAGALYRLSKVTYIGQKMFSTAGLKDKRGATTQRVSLFNSDVTNLYKFYDVWHKNKQIWIDDILENQDDKIGVGDLQGNQFGLILRCINHVQQNIIQERVKSLKQIGMINYFGMQRFGNFKTKTHEIGIQIINKNWQAVVQKLILQQTGDQNVNVLKQQLYFYKKYNEAERSLPNKMKLQKMLFKSLQRFGQNYHNVFDSLPRNMKTLYIHALQSYIWNKVTSRRFRQHGFKLVQGDLIGSTIQKMKQKEQQKQQEKERQEKEKENEEDQKQEDEDDQQFKLDVITLENIKKYTIFDLVAPLYGPSSQVPENCILHKYIEEQLQKLNLKSESFIENSKLLCFKGSFRRMIIKPQHVQYKIIKHSNKKAQLQSGFYTLGDQIDIQQGKHMSIQLILRLPKSSYATMAIRELLHLPSSFQCQKILNKMFEQE